MRISEYWSTYLRFKVLLASFMLTACASQTSPEASLQTSNTVLPATIPADQLVGRWGVASYHQEAARARTVAAAKTQCKQPYVITKGSTGGLMMHVADSATLQELVLKGSQSGKNYVGPPGEISTADREIVSVNNQMLVLRWMDPEIAGRYGTMVYVRCGKNV